MGFTGGHVYAFAPTDYPEMGGHKLIAAAAQSAGAELVGDMIGGVEQYRDTLLITGARTDAGPIDCYLMSADGDYAEVNSTILKAHLCADGLYYWACNAAEETNYIWSWMELRLIDEAGTQDLMTVDCFNAGAYPLQFLDDYASFNYFENGSSQSYLTALDTLESVSAECPDGSGEWFQDGETLYCCAYATNVLYRMSGGAPERLFELGDRQLMDIADGTAYLCASYDSPAVSAQALS